MRKRRINKRRRIVNKNHSMDLNSDPFELPARDYIYHQYNVDMNTMNTDDKFMFMDSENEKLTQKVEALAQGLSALIEKMQSKKESKPPQVFQRKNEETVGT